MSSCCPPANNGVDSYTVPSKDAGQMHVHTTVHCPGCGLKGKTMDTQTVKALLAVSLEVVRPIIYRFCRTESCPIVYFSADGRQKFTEAELRERVHQKHPLDDDVLVCYCFRHTPGTIRAELVETHQSTAVERVHAGIAAGQCACEVRNPQGSCCLGNVSAVVQQIATAVQLAPTLLPLSLDT